MVRVLLLFKFNLGNIIWHKSSDISENNGQKLTRLHRQSFFQVIFLLWVVAMAMTAGIATTSTILSHPSPIPSFPPPSVPCPSHGRCPPACPLLYPRCTSALALPVSKIATLAAIPNLTALAALALTSLAIAAITLTLALADLNTLALAITFALALPSLLPLPSP